MKPEKEWPCLEVDALPESDPEVKSERVIFTLTLPEKMCELLLKYSAWIVLQRKVAWLLKFKKYLLFCKDKHTSIDKYLTVADLDKATVAIVKLVRREVYAEEMYDLETKGNVKC